VLYTIRCVLTRLVLHAPKPTPSQGCSSGSEQYTASMKAEMQRAEILVVEKKLGRVGRDPITHPC